jgi:multicomponent Na+:H+ antiporter subunit F
VVLLAAGVAALVVAMALVIVRAIIGPSHYDRILAANAFGTKIVLLIAVIGYLFGRPHFLDVALAYALINFVATIALMKFFRYRSLAQPLTAGAAEKGGSDE